MPNVFALTPQFTILRSNKERALYDSNVLFCQWWGNQPVLTVLCIVLSAMIEPLDAPSFQPATVQICVQASIRIQDVAKSQEVLILTPVERTVDAILSHNPDPPPGNGGEMSDSDFSDFSETSSSESDHCDMDMDEQSIKPQDIRNGAPMKAYWLGKDPLCVVCCCLHVLFIGQLPLPDFIDTFYRTITVF